MDTESKRGKPFDNKIYTAGKTAGEKSMSKKSSSGGGLGRFWAILLTLILIAGIVLGVVYRKQVAVMWGDLTRYLKRVDDEVPKDDETPDDGDGTTDDEEGAEKQDNMLVSDVESNGLTLAMLPLAASDLSEQAESGLTITATVAPSYATDKTLDWTVEWADSSNSWAQGKTATDYVTVTTTADDSNVATLECLKDFAAQLVVKATSRSNPDAYARCTLDYYARVIGATLRFTNAIGEYFDYAMAQGNFYQTIIAGTKDVIEYEEGMANVPITDAICGEGVYTSVIYQTSDYTIPLNEESATKTEVFAYENDFDSYLIGNGFNTNSMGVFVEHRNIGAEQNIEFFDYKYLVLLDIWNTTPVIKLLFPVFADYVADRGAELLSVLNAYEKPAIIFIATYQDDMNDIRFGLALSYQKDYFEITVEDVEMDNSGVIL